MAHASLEATCLSPQSIHTTSSDSLSAVVKPMSNDLPCPVITPDAVFFEKAITNDSSSGTPNGWYAFQTKDQARLESVNPTPLSLLGQRGPLLSNLAKPGISVQKQSRFFGGNPNTTVSHGRVLREIQRNIGRERKVCMPGQLSALIREQQITRAGQPLNNILTSSRTNMVSEAEVDEPETANKENVRPAGKEPFKEKRSENFTGQTKMSRRMRSADSNRVGKRKDKESTPNLATEPTSGYVEALEAEVASLNTRLSSFSSPATAPHGSAKLRNMNSQNRMLRQEVGNWEQQFEDRVRHAVSERAACHADLQEKIRELEEEMRSRDERCKLLEKQIRECEERARQAEQGERLMSRRVDIFGAIVAGNPGRASAISCEGWATAPATPLLKEAPRPQKHLRDPQDTLYPRTRRLSISTSSRSTSPSRKRMFATAFDSSNSWHQGVGEVDTVSECAQDPVDNTSNTGISSALMSDYRSMTTESTHPTSLDFAELRSPKTLASRPTSLLSNASFSASWGLPASLGRSYADTTLPNQNGQHSSYQLKRMRRFPSTSGGLKPLILPSTMPCTPQSPSSPSRRQTLHSPSRVGSISDASFLQPSPSHSSGPTERAKEACHLKQDALSLQTSVKYVTCSGSLEDFERLKALCRLEGNDDGNARECSSYCSDGNHPPKVWQSYPCMSDEEYHSSTATLPTSQKIWTNGATSPLTTGSESSFLSLKLISTPSCSSSSDPTTSSLPVAASLRSESDERFSKSKFHHAGPIETPPRSSSPSLSETPKALESNHAGNKQSINVNINKDVNYWVPRPTCSTKQSSLKPEFENHQPTLVSLFPYQISSIPEITSNGGLRQTTDTVLTRLKDFAWTIFPQFEEDRDILQNPRVRTTQGPFSITRSVLVRSIDKSSKALESMSPFQLGGLGWWLFGLLHWRKKPLDVSQGRSSSTLSWETPASTIRDRELGFAGVEPERKDFHASRVEPLIQPRDEHVAQLDLGLPVGAPTITIMKAHHFSPNQRNVHLRNLCSSRGKGTSEATRHGFKWDSGQDIIRCSSCEEPLVRKKLRVWAKLALAIVLAIGISILEGPESLLCGDDNNDEHRR